MEERVRFMQLAYREAVKAGNKLEVPVGAVIVKDGVVISRGYNKRELTNDPTSHAEVCAIRKACKKLGTWRLSGCDLYVTLEPCPMCAGAIIQARIRTVYIGAMDPKAGCAGSVLDLFKVNKFNHQVQVEYGVMEKECSAILTDFFKKLRVSK